MNIDKIQILFPTEVDFDMMAAKRATIPFDDEVIDMLNTLSQSLLKDRTSRLYPDVVTFAFFCRKANLLKLKEEYVGSSQKSAISNQQSAIRLGRGLIFHIAPSNVPINFGYSLVAGLLAGNNNVVRVSSKQFPQVDLVIKHLHEIAKDYPVAKERIALVRYEHDSNANQVLSSLCNVRVIWGGDRTIATLRECAIPARSFDICFADRYSLAAINADELVKEQNMPALAEKFYNDTYLFDQNACSAPHLVVWTGTESNIEKAKDLFWSALHHSTTTHYTNFQDVMAVDKLTAMYKQAVAMDTEKEDCQSNVLVRVKVKDLDKDIDDYRCAGGYFTEYSVLSNQPSAISNPLDAIVPIIKNKYQTLAYYGYEKAILQDFVERNRLCGIDRIVPLGETTSFSLTWDGYNLINQLSRIIDIQ